MKRFSFPLHRVLEWRGTQAHMEELKLGRLHAELRGIEDRIAHARAERTDSQRALMQAGAATAAELAALDSFKKAVAAECARLESMADATRRKIAVQIQAVTAKRREARLLENLERRKLAAWKLQFGKELDQQAEEAHQAAHRRTGASLQVK
jgi:flagellar biosynthesis chaperone FliJ